MTAAEMAALADWLKAHGHTSDDVVDCIKSIANRSAK